ncbi:hypothetical protein [Shimia sp. MMG029]|uniref:hypothetical protein n=1 Tax=Shimia sp. MMG029 TaxID=3021978 RepID=UPI0022FE7BC9|nr:hypothetical protein [Shimia sp. MMG029]MDA5558691.1 hypothetical protein [Shimia sp. MMG029]
MFFNPAKTGLIALGASTFPNETDLDRQVFLNASERVIDYFRDPRKGLGVVNRNIFNGFNTDFDKPALLLKIDQFISTRDLSDIFVYICSHGYADGDYFRFLLKNSQTSDEDTCVNFERLIERIEDAASCRLYFLIDSCASGVVHRRSPELPLSPEAASYLSSSDTLALPRLGATILTANNSTAIGSVYAHDELDDFDLPIFTGALLNLLNDGNLNRAGFGLSFSQLSEELSDRIPNLIAQINEKNIKTGSEQLSDDHGTHTPQCSDRPVFDSQNGNLISRIGVFPNNDPNHLLISQISRRVRISYSREVDQFERIEHLEAEIDPLKDRISELESDTKIAQEKIQSLSKSRKNRLIWLAAVTFLLLILLYLVLVESPLLTSFSQGLKQLFN